jgi:hypothetical protein
MTNYHHHQQERTNKQARHDENKKQKTKIKVSVCLNKVINLDAETSHPHSWMDEREESCL